MWVLSCIRNRVRQYFLVFYRLPFNFIFSLWQLNVVQVIYFCFCSLSFGVMLKNIFAKAHIRELSHVFCKEFCALRPMFRYLIFKYILSYFGWDEGLVCGVFLVWFMFANWSTLLLIPFVKMQLVSCVILVPCWRQSWIHIWVDFLVLSHQTLLEWTPVLHSWRLWCVMWKEMVPHCAEDGSFVVWSEAGDVMLPALHLSRLLWQLFFVLFCFSCAFLPILELFSLIFLWRTPLAPG